MGRSSCLPGFFETKCSRMSAGVDMDIVRALFVPMAVVDRNTYWIGALILICAGLVITGLPILLLSDKDPGFGAVMSAGMSSTILLLLIYPWFCLIAGRLRDAGASPWFFLLGLLGYVVLAQIFVMFLVMPGMADGMLELAESLPTEDEHPAEAMKTMMAMQAEMMKDMLPGQMVGNGIASVLAALPFGFLTKGKDEVTESF